MILWNASPRVRILQRCLILPCITKWKHYLWISTSDAVYSLKSCGSDSIQTITDYIFFFCSRWAPRVSGLVLPAVALSSVFIIQHFIFSLYFETLIFSLFHLSESCSTTDQLEHRYTISVVKIKKIWKRFPFTFSMASCFQT